MFRSVALTVALLLLGLIGATSLAAEETRVGDIAVSDPWARASAGMARAGAAFMTLVNHGAQADRLVEVETSVARNPELHTHIHEAGVMKMRRVPAIEVPAGSTVELEPGGLHVMLMGLVEPLQEGDSFTLTLRFETAGETSVTVPVMAIGAMHGGGMGQGHGMGHGKGHGKGKGASGGQSGTQ